MFKDYRLSTYDVFICFDFVFLQVTNIQTMS